MKLSTLQNGNAVDVKSISTTQPEKTAAANPPSNGMANCINTTTPSCIISSKEPNNALHIAPDQNSDSNLSNSDLSSLSDIARTVETASVVINQTTNPPSLPPPNAATLTVPKEQKDKLPQSVNVVVIPEKPIEYLVPPTIAAATHATIVAASPAPISAIPVVTKPILTAASVAIPIMTTSVVTSQTCIQFVPVLTAASKIQFIGQNNVSLCLNIIQPVMTTSTDHVSISAANPTLPSLKRPLLPSIPVTLTEPKKPRIDCSNIIKLEPTNDDKGVIIIENGVLQSREEVTIKTGHQTNISDVSAAGGERNIAPVKQVLEHLVSKSAVAKGDDKKQHVVDDKKRKTSNDVNKLEYTCDWQGCGRYVFTRLWGRDLLLR